MGIDWEFVGSLTEQQLKDSEDEFHQDICEILRSDINESDLTDSTKVKHLLRIAGYVKLYITTLVHIYLSCVDPYLKLMLN